MRIFIVGAGEVGYHIASSLAGEGHDLVIVDRDREKVRRLETTLDVMAVHGDGSDPAILRSNGIDAADLFFAVSNDDASNLLGALTARRLGAPRCVVRVGQAYHGRNPLLEEDEGITPLYPERLVAEEILSLTRIPGASKVRYFEQGRLVLLQTRPSDTAEIYGRPLREMGAPGGWILTGIRKGTGVVIPRGDSTLERGQQVYAVGRAETAATYLHSLGLRPRSVRGVVIAGAGQVGAWLTQLLVKEKIRVTVVQRGLARAEALAAQVPQALVLKGDATDPSMLREAGVQDADYFVAATQDDESNILSSLLARELGAGIVVTLYNRPEFLSVLRATRIDLPISPRMVIAGTILRMVHRREIVSLDVMEGGEAEVVEFEVPPRAKVLREPLADLHFPRNAIVGAVVRGDEIFVPGGTFRFEKGDRALIFARSDVLPELERLFRGR